MKKGNQKDEMKKKGPTEIWTRIVGFKVQSANHYTMGPHIDTTLLKMTKIIHQRNIGFLLVVHVYVYVFQQTNLFPQKGKIAIPHDEMRKPR